MAKNQPSSTRDKAKAMREAQQKKEKRVRNLIIAIVSVIVVAVIATLIIVITTVDKDRAKSGFNGVQSGGQSGEIPPIADGGPIVISDLGVGKSNPDAPNLDLFFSYTCHACATLEEAVGASLAKDALDGQYNLVLHPVDTATMAFQGPATNAALIVAEQDPENFVAFHRALMLFLNEEVNVKKDGTIVQNTASSKEKVAEMAKEVGVPQDIIDQFGDEATEYIAASQEIWRNFPAEGRDGLATPEMVFMGTVIPWTGNTPSEMYQNITTAMQQIADAQTGNSSQS